ncbi:MAG TPA: DUF302 domain-containing protein [Fimbriimonadaceae bacterium]|nr:DUF302 domain-containing protein [Fimbriimonadaceae bacterium]
MADNNFAFVVQTDKNVSEAVVAVRKAAEAAKWSVLGGYDFDEILASKGFEQGAAIRSLDLCNAKHANDMIEKDQLTVLCMPCNVVVFATGGKTQIAAMKPGYVMPAMFPDGGDAMRDHAQQVDEELQAILTAAAS